MKPATNTFNLEEALKHIRYCPKLSLDQKRYVYSQIRSHKLPNRALEAVLMHMHKEVTNAKLKRPFELIVEDALEVYTSGF